MKRQKICPLCNNDLKKGEAVFAFPRLPVSYTYSKFAGMVHVVCLRESSEADNIRKELTEACLNYSPYPVISREDGILIQKHERDGCFVVYDFNDFAVFPIPYPLIHKIGNIHTANQLKLDANGFLRLLIGNNLELNLYRPFSEETIMLSSLPLKRLNEMLGNISAREKAEKSEKLILDRRVIFHVDKRRLQSPEAKITEP